ncbi:MAG: hypothetical protein ACYC33_06875 [Thermoleophilia bacterium]
MNGFVFVHQNIQLDYGEVVDLPRKILAKAGDVSERRHLNINFLGSDESRAILQSPTSSTSVEITSKRIALMTNYFGELAGVDAFAERRKYADDKLRALIDWLSGTGLLPVYFGITSVAHMSAEGHDPTMLKNAAARALCIPPLMHENAPLYDFSFRVARAVEGIEDSSVGDFFSNLSVNWYQTRSYSGPPIHQISVWDMQLTEQGLEFRYDRNNKSALFAGRRDWSLEDFRAAAALTLTDIEPAFHPVASAIAAEMEGA